MRFSIFIALTMSLAACASANKSAPPPAQSASPAAAQTPAAKPAEKMAATTGEITAKATCTSGKDSRTLAVLTKDKGCELEYTKNGKASVVASAVNGSKHCEDKLTSIKDKLVNAGFNCQ